MNFTDLVAYSLATYRGTKLVMDDEITAELREKAIDQLSTFAQENPRYAALAAKLEYLIGCPWCVSIWVGGALAIVRRVNPALGDLLALLLATSALTGLLKSNEYRLGVE